MLFCNGQHDFLGGEKVKREGGKNPLLELTRGPLWHTRLATMPRVARRTKDAM